MSAPNFQQEVLCLEFWSNFSTSIVSFIFFRLRTRLKILQVLKLFAGLSILLILRITKMYL